MQIIKKYANRKLYHTNRKQYITLDGIAALIQDDQQVQVIDNETGQDITAPILAQVALQARSERGWPSTGALADLIRTGSDTIAGMGRSILAGLNTPTQIDTEIARRIDQLEQAGQIESAEATRMRTLLLHHPPSQASDLPSRNDINQLREQVESLTMIVEQILREKK
ncbi:MAG: polyhydroxyalkanoate synthesis regulator DNA-binding domain-containing protein [Roseiflexaceae bacterium]